MGLGLKLIGLLRIINLCYWYSIRERVIDRPSCSLFCTSTFVA